VHDLGVERGKNRCRLKSTAKSSRVNFGLFLQAFDDCARRGVTERLPLSTLDRPYGTKSGGIFVVGRGSRMKCSGRIFFSFWSERLRAARSERKSHPVTPTVSCESGRLVPAAPRQVNKPIVVSRDIGCRDESSGPRDDEAAEAPRWNPAVGCEVGPEFCVPSVQLKRKNDVDGAVFGIFGSSAGFQDGRQRARGAPGFDACGPSEACPGLGVG